MLQLYKGKDAFETLVKLRDELDTLTYQWLPAFDKFLRSIPYTYSSLSVFSDIKPQQIGVGHLCSGCFGIFSQKKHEPSLRTRRSQYY